MNNNGKSSFDLNLSSLKVNAPEKQSEVGNEFCLKQGSIILQPIAMRIFNSDGIYLPNRRRSQKEVSYEEFLQRYSRHGQKVRVCFDENPSAATLLQHSEWVIAYGFGWDAWYIIISPDSENSFGNRRETF